MNETAEGTDIQIAAPDTPAFLSAVDLPNALAHAAKSVSEATSAYVFDGNIAPQDHTEDTAHANVFIAGDDDARDAALHETPTDERSVWHGPIFDISRLEVTLPDGRPAQRDIVRHPGAVAIVALTDDGRICLVRQYRAALDRVTVEIPAGKLDPGEDPLDCAHRELREETGMVAERMAFLTTIATGVGFCDELIHLYMATGLSFGVSDPDTDEFIAVDLVELSELIDAVLDGRVEDAKTVVGALICDAIAHRLSSAE